MFSIGFYSKQFLFFVLVGTLLTGVFWVVKNQTGSASGRPILVDQAAENLVVDIQLFDQGKAEIQGITMPGLIQFRRDGDELRYLLLDQPNTDITTLTVTVTFPRAVDERLASASILRIHDLSTDGTAHWTSPTTLEYSFENIGPSAVVTLIAEIPKGVIVPSFTQSLFGAIQGLPQVIWVAAAIILPLLTLLLLLLVLGNNVRERLATSTSERQTLPETISPGLVSAIVDGHVSARSIAAILLDLARREYLEIASHDGTYTFTKRRRLLDNTPNDLAPFEQTLLEKLFTDGPQASEADIRVRIGSSLFSKKVAAVYVALYETVTKQGYFAENPRIIQGSYRLAGLALFFLGMVGFLIGAISFNDPPTLLLFWIGMILSALVVIHLAPRMPTHTPAGLARRKEWLKFKNYLQSRKQLSFDAGNNEQFLQFLPYAIALGVETDWSQRFLRTPFHLPSWYVPNGMIAQLEDFASDILPIVGFLSREFAAVKEPTLS